MPETLAPLPVQFPASSRGDRVTRWFLGVVVLLGIIYAGFGLTPSSYGIVLDALHASDEGPVAGSARPIRSDEWSISNPNFQAAVRNRFQRMNETSFYREDLRNFYALPLKDWSLVFKPQLWAFFVLPPATAFSIYYALLMCAFVAGLQLLFRHLGVPAGVSAAAAVIVCFSGFCQFWWTTYLPLFAGLPWILLVVLKPSQGWTKLILCIWAFPALVLAHAYPPLLLTFAWGGLIMVLAFRPALLRSPADIGAIAVGILAVAIVVYAYYADVIPVMRNTLYPGHRIAPAGTATVAAVLSEIFPFLDFRLTNFRNLTGPNICEIGALGSFLPILTLCLTRYRALREHRDARKTLLILLAGFAAITLWEIAPVPAWIGRILLWDTGEPQRWLFTSGFLLTLASLVIWSNRLISLHPFRIALFVFIGPVVSILLKMWLSHRWEPASNVFSNCLGDFVLCGLAMAAGLVSWYLPVTARGTMLVVTVALMNVLCFARFNPLQPAEPIFHIPETDVMSELRQEAAASPDGVLVDSRFLGSVFNGIGFRSVAHTLLAPKLDFFRQYFPTMDPEQFNTVFNRYAHIRPMDVPLPDAPMQLVRNVIKVPMEVFVPVRNIRRVMTGPAQPDACFKPPAGGIANISMQGATVTVEGWAPWTAESDAQGIRVLSARSLRADSLSTITRPDIAEQMRDYRFVKSGFELRISSADGKPLRREDLAILAFGTSQGEVRLSCCGCP